MDYLHLISNARDCRLVQRVARNDPTLQELCTRTGDADTWLAMGHALIGNTCLVHLHLNHLNLTKEAAHALAQGIAQSKVEILELRGYQKQSPQESSDKRISDIVYRGIQSCNTIQEIWLSLSQKQDPGSDWREALLGVASIKVIVPKGHGYIQAFSEVLTRTTLLRELCVELRKLGSNHITMLAHGIRHNKSITSLCLRKADGHNSQHVQLLFAQGLCPNSTITKLDTSQYPIDDGSVELLVDCWLPNCPMKELILINNNIGPVGAQRLMQALENHPTMLELNLSRNKRIGYEGLRMIGNELPNLHRLTRLDLEDCAIWRYFRDAMSEAAQAERRARQQAGQALLDGIKHNLSITDLVVRGSYSKYLSENVEDEIDFYCSLNRTGRYLLSANDDHGVAASVWCRIFVKCQRQPHFGTSLIFFYLKEQPTLVQSRRY